MSGRSRVSLLATALLLAACAPAPAQCPGVDLVFLDLQLDIEQPLPPGGWTRVTALVGNQGESAFPGGVPLAVFLTPDGQVRPGEPALAVLTVGPIASGDTTRIETVAYLSPDAQDGQYYVRAAVDPNDTLTQCSTANDVVGSSGPVFVVLTPDADDHPPAASGVRDPFDRLSSTVPGLDGAIESNQDVDVFRLDVTAGAAFEFTVSLGSLSDSFLELLGPDGTTVIAQNDDDPSGGLGSRIAGQAPAAPLFARVRHLSPSGTGTYRVTLRLPAADDHPGSAQQTQSPRDLLSAAAPRRDGTIEIPGDVDFFRVELTTGVRYAVETSVASEGDTVLELFAESGGSLGASDDLPHSRASYLETTGPAGGVVFAAVRAPAGQSGGYQLALRAVDDHPDGPEFASAPRDRLSSGAPELTGTIERGGDSDYFRVDVERGGSYELAVTLQGLADSALTVYGSDQRSTIADNDDDGELRSSRVVFAAAEPATLYARVRGAASSHTGGYRVRLSRLPPDDHPDEPGSLAAPRDTLSATTPELIASLERPGDTDFFRAEVEVGAPYRVSVELAGAPDAELVLATPEGTSLGGSQDAGPSAASSVELQGPAGGAVVARVRGVSSSGTGRYRIRLVRLRPGGDDHPEAPAETRFPEDALTDTLTRNSGSLGGGQDADLFRLVLTQGARYRLAVGVLGLASVEATVLASDGVTVLASSSTLVMGSGGTPGLLLELAGPAGRVAYLRLRSPAGEAGFYAIELVRADDHPDTADRVTESDALGIIGVPVGGVLDPASDQDVFVMRLTAGRPYRVEVKPLAGQVVSAELLDLDGTTVAQTARSPAAGQAATLRDFAVLSSATYYVRVSSGGSGGGGPYFVRLLLPQPQVSLASTGASGRLTATLAVSGLPGPLTAAIALLQFDKSALTARSSFSGVVNGIKHAGGSPFSPLILVAAAPEGADGAGTATTATLGVLEFDSTLGGAGHVGRLTAMLTLLVCDTDTFAVFAPATDAGLPRVLEAFDGAGILRAVIPELPPRQETLGKRVRLDGSLSADPNVISTALTYDWKVLKSPGPVTLLEPASASPAFEPSRPGEYAFALVVGNGRLTGMRQTVNVIVNRIGETPTAVARGGPAQSPSAAATAYVTVEAGSGDVRLDGSLSSSPVATRAAALTYRWEQLEGPPAVLAPSAQVVSPTFTPAGPGLHVFQLSVADAEGSVSPFAPMDVLVLEPKTRAPTLTLAAVSSTTGVIGVSSDLVGSPGARSLRVTLPTTVTLEATVSDPDVGAGSQGLLYGFQQTSGPRVSLSKSVEDTQELRVRTSFSPDRAGVHEFECRVREVRGGKPTDVAVRRRIRVVVDSATRAVPTARAGLRALGKGGLSAAILETTTVALPAGVTAALDGRASSVSVTGPPATLRYLWRQVAGPQAVLSNPFGSISTFVVPDVPAGAPRTIRYEVVVDDGLTRSEPAQVDVLVLASALPRGDLLLHAGPNLVGLDVLPRAPGGRYSLGDLMRDAGAPALAYLDYAQTPPRFRTLLVGSPEAAAKAVDGSDGYVLLSTGTSRRVPLAGDRWSPESLHRLLVPGLNLVHMPRGVPDGFTSGSLLASTGASWALAFEPAASGLARARIHLPGSGTTAFELGAGQAVLLHLPGTQSRQIDLPER
ncbi:MAG: hypothetical protein HY816_06925 [Candidatus Wallbacteria bacterium]|nr:hypothetical protein [Candidatus Wallbacteria bacterium]